MSRTIRRLALVASLLVAPALLAVVAPESAAHAETATTASKFLEGRQNALIAMLTDPKVKSADERAKNVNAELLKLIDYTEMAKASLGDEWAKRSEAEQSQFKGLLQKLIEKSYKQRLDELANYAVAYNSESASGSDTTVKTTATSKKDKRAAPLLIDYVLRKKGSEYVVVDIIPEGSSYVKTYHKEFKKVLDKKPADGGGWDGLIAKMNKKLTEK